MEIFGYILIGILILAAIGIIGMLLEKAYKVFLWVLAFCVVTIGPYQAIKILEINVPFWVYIILGVLVFFAAIGGYARIKGEV